MLIFVFSIFVTVISLVTMSDDESAESNEKKGILNFAGIGIIFGLLAAFFAGVNALLVKMVHLHGVQVTLLRVGGQLLIILPILFQKRDTVDILGPIGYRRSLWLRGFAGSTNLIFLYLAVTSLPLGDAVTITYLSLVFIPLISRIFLKEAFTITDIIFAVLAVVGVTLIARPAFLFPSNDAENVPNPIGVMYGLISACLRAVSIVSLRDVGPNTYPFLNMAYYCVCGIVTTSVILAITNVFEFPCFSTLPYIFCLGLMGVFGQFCLTMSTKTERAGTVAILKSSQIIFVYVMQVKYIFFA